MFWISLHRSQRISKTVPCTKVDWWDVISVKRFASWILDITVVRGRQSKGYNCVHQILNYHYVGKSQCDSEHLQDERILSWWDM